MGTRGRAFGDRYHARELAFPRMVRNVLAYVLKNLAHHDRAWAGFADPYSSASAFDGWSTAPRPTWVVGTGPPPVTEATTWLLTLGWKRRGLIDPATIPGKP
jgi:putative transposase